MRRSLPLALLLAAAALVGALSGPAAAAEKPFIIVASTTSTENSGLLAHLLPIFSARSGIEVRVVARGTGQAIRMAEAGDADVLLVHHRPSEERFVAEGHGLARYDVMYNDFVLVGPESDPAGVRGEADVAAALAKIASRQAVVVSRGDDSGTHKKELGLWQDAGIDPRLASGTWYREAGSGMGATLNIAAAIEAYSLSDRATWLAFRNKRRLVVVSEGDPRLFNQYGVILVNQARHPHVKAKEGQAFIDWLISPEGQAAIAAFSVEGQRLFFPNAKTGSS